MRSGLVVGQIDLHGSIIGNRGIRAADAQGLAGSRRDRPVVDEGRGAQREASGAVHQVVAGDGCPAGRDVPAVEEQRAAAGEIGGSIDRHGGAVLHRDGAAIACQVLQSQRQSAAVGGVRYRVQVAGVGDAVEDEPVARFDAPRAGQRAAGDRPGRAVIARVIPKHYRGPHSGHDRTGAGLGDVDRPVIPVARTKLENRAPGRFHRTGVGERASAAIDQQRGAAHVGIDGAGIRECRNAPRVSVLRQYQSPGALPRVIARDRIAVGVERHTVELNRSATGQGCVRT